MSERVVNFCAGPAVLPEPVLEEVRRDLLALPGVGMSILEISHRSKWADDIFEEAEANLRELWAIPKDYRVLFLQGGAQLQFSMIPINFLDGAVADYIVTGTWGAKAVKEAEREGTAHIAWDGRPDNCVRVPRGDELQLSDEARYVYFTSNETIQGVQFGTEPPVGDVPLVCDCSSDFLSRPVEVDRYGLLYACAQKNAGPAGLTVVVVSDELLERRRDGLHSMLDYRRHAEAGSRLNTPPMFAIYVFLLVTRWIRDEMDGLEALESFNRKKAQLLYDTLDSLPDFYRTHAEPGSRSMMNVTFRTPSPEVDARFLEQASARGLEQLKGHRSVGGMRASIYNAMPRAGVERLRDFLVDFVRDTGH